MRHISKYLITAALVAPMSVACTWDPAEHDTVPVEESMVLTASATEVTLLEENLKKEAVTFTWTPAREMSDEYLVSYETKLDVQGNNFGSKTVISTDMDPDEFSQSFTVEQITNWANERWALPVNKKFTLEFRVIAQWEGGETFEIPEVKTATVEITPIKVIIFDADKMSVGGTAVEETEMSKTLENTSQYAWRGDLTIGDLQIPVQYEGVNYYIHAADGSTALRDGQAVDVVMDEEPGSWDIKTAGTYRVVVNMEQKKVTIYSPETDLQPLTVTWRPNLKVPEDSDNGHPLITTTIEKIYVRGESVGWTSKGKDIGFKASLADPQIFVYSAEKGFGSGRTDFAIISEQKVEGYNSGNAYTVNNSYVFAPVYTGKDYDQSMEVGKWMDMEGGSHLRGNYFKIPSGTNFIILDLRNMQIKIEKRTY